MITEADNFWLHESRYVYSVFSEDRHRKRERHIYQVEIVHFKPGTQAKSNLCLRLTFLYEK